MPEPFPNHAISIPNSVVSFKHYFLIHDQRFGRTAIYLAILAVLITAVSMGLGLLGYAREAPKIEARQARELTEKLASLSFKDGKAASQAPQPAVVYEDFDTFGREEGSAEAEGKPKPRKLRTLVAVLDTTGKATTWEKAAEFAGCAEPQRVLLFGQRGVTSLDLATAQPEPKEPKPEPYTKEKLEELRKLIEEKGGKLPELTLDETGAAKFTLEAGKVHLALHTPELMVLVDATGKGLGLNQARWVLAQERPEIQMPEFLVLISAAEVILKAAYEKAPRTLDVAALSAPDAATLARWAAATARLARHDIIAKGLLPNVVKMLFYLGFELLIISLICSVAGLIVNGMLRAGIPYSQILTMAVYAMTPARLVLPILVSLVGLQASWVAVLPFVVGMGYTAMAAYRTAREIGGTGAAPHL